MKIGIVTFHRAYNCGAMLQAWAFKSVLEHRGHEVVFLASDLARHPKRFDAHCPPGRTGLAYIRGCLGAFVINVLSLGIVDLVAYRFRRFLKANLPEKSFSGHNYAEGMDMVSLGSDMIWCPELTRADSYLYFGEDASNVRMVSYAASAGDRPVTEETLVRIASFSKRADGISVREQYLKDQIKPVCEKNVQVVVDPTLLLDAADYEPITAPRKHRRPYLFFYTLYIDRKKMLMARRVAKRLHLDLVVHAVYQRSLYHTQRGLTYCVPPEDFLSYMKNASCVMASSFHAAVFPVIFNRPFVYLETSDSGKSRGADLLQKLGLSERICLGQASEDCIVDMLSTSLPPELPGRVAEYRQASIEYIDRWY